MAVKRKSAQKKRTGKVGAADASSILANALSVLLSADRPHFTGAPRTKPIGCGLKWRTACESNGRENGRGLSLIWRVHGTDVASFKSHRAHHTQKTLE